MANPFQVNVLGGMNVGQEMRAAETHGMQKAEQERLAVQRTKMQEAMRGAIAGDADAIQSLFEIHPEMGLKMENRLAQREVREGELANKAKTEAELEWAIQYRQALRNGNEEATKLLVDEAESNPLIEFDSTMIGKDPNQDNLVINSMLFVGLGKDGYKALVEGKRPEKGTFSIKENTLGYTRLNTATGEVIQIASDSVAAENQRKLAKEELTAQLKTDNDTFARSTTIRNRYDKKTTEFAKVRDAYARIEASAKDPDPAGDLALIFNYMKMLDPGSTVRESEFATAENAGSVETRVVQQYNKLISGKKLTAGQRKEFVGRAKMLMGKADKQQARDRADAIAVGKQWNVSEDQIFGAASQVMKFDINGNQIQ